MRLNSRLETGRRNPAVRTRHGASPFQVHLMALENYQDGMYGFNGWSDGWAAIIVLERLRLVQFTVESNAFASVPKDRLRDELPARPMREFMLGIKPDVVAPAGDADGPPAISIMRPDYVSELKRVSFGGWKTADGHEVLMFKDDPKGRALVVTKADAGVATDEWWRALKNPALGKDNQ